VAALLKIGVVAAFWLAVGLIQTFNWGHGAEKAAVMLVLLIVAPFAVLMAGRSARPLAPGIERGITIAAAACLALEIVYLGARIIHPHLIDVATTTLAAGTALLHGGNPYALPIDTGPETAGFTGYKYLPVMIAAYWPLGTIWGERGVLATNLVLLLACLWLMRRLARSALAPFLLLSLPIVPEQIFAKGATDPAAVLPLLAAFLLSERSEFLSGLCVGLSIAAKPAPGVLFLPCLIPATRRWHYAAGVALGLVPILPFLWLSPQDLLANVVSFNLSRAADGTSWLAGTSVFTRHAARLAMLAFFAGASIYVWRRAPPLAARCMTGAMLAIAALLTGPAAHHNYQLWWLPFYAVALSLALAPQEACQETAFRYTNSAETGSRRS
jgi:Glycosyltransferase family 87